MLGKHKAREEADVVMSLLLCKTLGMMSGAYVIYFYCCLVPG